MPGIGVDELFHGFHERNGEIMMLVEEAQIVEHITIAKDIYKLTLQTSIARFARAGQFVQVEIPGFFLRRPISICRILNAERIVLVYRTVGEGTKKLSTIKEGKVNLFGPLGNGFPIEERDVLLIGGGIGVPPLLETAAQYKAGNRSVIAVLGFNSAADVILETEFKALGCQTYTATMDGSYGTRGTVLDAIRKNNIDFSFVMACGPKAMLKAVQNAYQDGYISLEERMACGMGACMGCVTKDIDGNALRICKEGPVFPIGKVVLS